MCYKYVSVTLALSVAIFLSACKRNSVSLEFTNAKGEVPQLNNFVFRFNKSLVKDSLLNFWDSTEYVSFEPKIPGRFRWQSPDELIFSPSKPLLPATEYKAKIKEEVLRYTSYDNVAAKDDIQFHTASLLLTDAQVSWVLQDESSRIALPQFNLQFNYPVKPEDLKEKLNITVEGKPTEYSIQTISPSNQVVVRLTNFKGEDKNYEAKLKIAKGLTPQDGQKKHNRRFRITFIHSLTLRVEH